MLPHTAERLEQLARRGAVHAPVLRADASGDIAYLEGDESDLGHLESAFLALASGNVADAAAVLQKLSDPLPRGLLGCRDELLARLATSNQNSEELVAGGGERPISAGNTVLSHTVDPLKQWQTNVRGWREVLGV